MCDLCHVEYIRKMTSFTLSILRLLLQPKVDWVSSFLTTTSNLKKKDFYVFLDIKDKIWSKRKQNSILLGQGTVLCFN